MLTSDPSPSSSTFSNPLYDSLCNEENNDSYKGLEKVDDEVKGSEVSITDHINNENVWMRIEALPYWKWREIRILKAVRKVIILALKPGIIMQQICTSLNIKGTDESWNPAELIVVASENAGSIFNNDILIYTDDSYDVSMKPSSPSCM